MIFPQFFFFKLNKCYNSISYDIEEWTQIVIFSPLLTRLILCYLWSNYVSKASWKQWLRNWCTGNGHIASVSWTIFCRAAWFNLCCSITRLSYEDHANICTHFSQHNLHVYIYISMTWQLVWYSSGFKTCTSYNSRKITCLPVKGLDHYTLK